MVISLAFIFGFLPSLIWLIFFLQEDDYPEPKKIIIKVFFCGFIIALIAAGFQYLFRDILNFFNIGENEFFFILVLVSIEEVLKFIAVYLSVARSKFFDEPVDAMIYMITAALGFAAMENLFLAIGFLFKDGYLSSSFFEVLIIRSMGATLLHALSSSIVGYYWAKKMIKCQALNVKRKTFYNLLIIGLIIATLLHAVFNYLIISFSDGRAVIYPTLLLVIVALFIFKDFDKIKIADANNAN